MLYYTRKLDYANITLTASTDKEDELLKELQNGYANPIPNKAVI